MSQSAPSTATPEQYERWFTQTPDPWTELPKLEHGGDRTRFRSIEDAVRSANAAQAVALEKKLLAVLAVPGCTDAARLFVVRLLAIVGGTDTAAALTDWVADPKRTDLARVALDPNPAALVDEAYRAALLPLTGAAQLGLIGSIAERGDRVAMPALERLAADGSAPADTRAAAKRAVAQLGRPAGGPPALPGGAR